MRRVVTLLVLSMCLSTPARAQDAYAAILLQYLRGDASAALEKLRHLPYGEIWAGVDAFNTTRARQVLTGAAAMHTELAFHRGGGLDSDYHLRIATTLVEFGEHVRAGSNVSYTIEPQFAAPVPDDFRRLWYCTVINGLEGAVLPARADNYLAHALELYPQDAEIQLLAGIAAEMRASPRVVDASAGGRRRALNEAEKHYRAAIARAPDRLEARLRLAHVLQQLGKPTEARALLTPLGTSPDGRLAYLSLLFLGGIDDDEHRPADAATAYERAAIVWPHGQTARLALSEMRHRSGDRQAAADALAAAAGDANAFDPWWTYVFGEYWRIDLLLDAIRATRHP